MQPDTVISNPANPQAFNRFAYGLNNPSRYTDPSGHAPCDAKHRDDGPQCLKGGWINNSSDTYWRNEKYQDECWEGKHGCDEIAGGVELVTSVVIEPADWAYSAYHCTHGNCSPWMLLGLLPFIPATLGSYGDDAVDLYRAVSTSELDDIFDTRIFRPKPGGGSFDVKEFWLTMKGARGFAEHYNLPEIVKVTVPKHILEYASATWSNLDQLGPAAGWVDDGLDAFNDAIISISHVWSK